MASLDSEGSSGPRRSQDHIVVREVMAGKISVNESWFLGPHALQGWREQASWVPHNQGFCRATGRAAGYEDLSGLRSQVALCSQLHNRPSEALRLLGHASRTGQARQGPESRQSSSDPALLGSHTSGHLVLK